MLHLDAARIHQLATYPGLVASLKEMNRQGVDRLDRMRQTLGYRETLKRGYAVVRAGETLVTRAAEAAAAATLEIEFHDGRVAAHPGAGSAPAPGPAAPAAPTPRRRSRKDEPPEQGSLF